MLMGLKEEAFEVGSIDQGSYFLSASAYHRTTKFKFEMIGVYGPANHGRSTQFLEELERKVASFLLLVVVLGDFNLIRGHQDKNNNNINWPLTNAFNDSIARMALREIARSGARFTWSNKQRNPVRCILDRVLVSPEWETKFPLTSLLAIPSIGSDHTPSFLTLEICSLSDPNASSFKLAG
jgi:endonuclease/exonuclease/phosphatase family metal-dependent hydrolase